MRRNLALVIVVSGFLFGCEKMLLGPEPDNTASGNFEILWKTLDENYALFGVKRINWDSLRAVYNARITATTTDSELWDVMTGLLSNLDDGHVTLFNKDRSRGFNSSHLSRRPLSDFSLDLVTNRYLSTYAVAGAGYIVYGMVRGRNIGYIHIASFAAATSGDGIDWAYDIDKVVRELRGSDGLIVDVRNNGGGLRVTGNIINSAFIDHDMTYFYQRLKTGPGHNDFGSPRPISLSRRPGIPTFTKRIALLTNRLSGSGSEYTAQVFKNLSYSTQIGDTTFGAFGEITMVAQLPNGWTFWYPCTLTTTPDGKCYEGIGVLPDILVENTKADIDAGNDNVMAYAVQYLSQ